MLMSYMKFVLYVVNICVVCRGFGTVMDLDSGASGICPKCNGSGEENEE